MLFFYMMPVWIIICSVVRKFFFSNNKISNWVYLILCFMPITIFIAQENRPLADTEMYSAFFKDMDYRNFYDVIYGYDQYNGFVEKGYLILTKLLYEISADITIYFLMFGLFTYMLIAYFIYKEANDIVVSTMLFFLLTYALYPGIAIRQWIAVAIFLVSFNKYLVKKEYVKYCICIIFAAQIHMSAYILLLLPAYTIFKLNKHFILTICLSSIGLLVFYLCFTSMFTGIDNKYALYMSDITYQQGFSLGLGMLKIVFFWLIPIIVIKFKMIKCVNIIKEYPHIEWYLLFALFCILITIAQYTFLFMIQRMIHYFELYTVFLLPCFLDCLPIKCNKYIASIALLLVFIVYYIFKIDGMVRASEIII